MPPQGVFLVAKLCTIVVRIDVSTRGGFCNAALRRRLLLAVPVLLVGRLVALWAIAARGGVSPVLR